MRNNKEDVYLGLGLRAFRVWRFRVWGMQFSALTLGQSSMQF